MNKLHLLPRAQLADIPATLRLMADEIERGEYDNVLQGAIVLQSSSADKTIKDTHVFSCGDTSEDKCITLLNRGIHLFMKD